MIEALFILLGSMCVFLMIVVGVLRSFGLITDAFPPAFSDYEQGAPSLQETMKPNDRT